MVKEVTTGEATTAQVNKEYNKNSKHPTCAKNEKYWITFLAAMDLDKIEHKYLSVDDEQDAIVLLRKGEVQIDDHYSEKFGVDTYIAVVNDVPIVFDQSGEVPIRLSFIPIEFFSKEFPRTYIDDDTFDYLVEDLLDDDFETIDDYTKFMNNFISGNVTISLDKVQYHISDFMLYQWVGQQINSGEILSSNPFFIDDFEQFILGHLERQKPESKEAFLENLISTLGYLNHKYWVRLNSCLTDKPELKNQLKLDLSDSVIELVENLCNEFLDREEPDFETMVQLFNLFISVEFDSVIEAKYIAMVQRIIRLIESKYSNSKKAELFINYLIE